MTGSMLPRDRCDYSAIVDRPAMKLPGGARIVIWTIVNLEVWDIGKPMARQVLPAERVTVPRGTFSDGLHDIGDDRRRDLFERAATVNAGWKTDSHGIDHDDAIPRKTGRKQDVERRTGLVRAMSW